MEYLKSPHNLNLAAEFETWGNSIRIKKNGMLWELYHTYHYRTVQCKTSKV